MRQRTGSAGATGAIPAGIREMLNTFGEDFYPQRVHEIMEYEVEEELSLYDPRTEVVHILNPTAAVIWRLCNGDRALQEICVEIGEAYNLAPSVAEGDVKEVLSRFLQAGLIRA